MIKKELRERIEKLNKEQLVEVLIMLIENTPLHGFARFVILLDGALQQVEKKGAGPEPANKGEPHGEHKFV